MINFLKKYGNVFEDSSLKEHNTYRIGGIAKYLVLPSNVDNFIELIKFLKTNNINYKILGNGSNIIIGSKKYDGVIIKLSNLDSIEVDREKLLVNAEAGVMLYKLTMKTLDYNLSGLEWAAGIPGTVGGSIIGNAGAYNIEIFDCLNTITILNTNNEVKTLNINEIRYGYRDTEFKENGAIILSATFKLKQGNKNESLELISARREKRLTTQPLEYPSAGSVFKNPSEEDIQKIPNNIDIKGPYAGHLIEECGLKGTTINDAQISEKHANFIINRGNATSEDIKALIDLAKEEVYNKYGYVLKPEQEFFNWE